MIPRLSDHLKIDPKALRAEGVFDAFLGIDTRLFLDPHLLKSTTIHEFKESHDRIEKYFNELITLLSASLAQGDRAWKEANRRLIFKEMPGIAIGYGKGDSPGSGIGPKLARTLIESADQIVKMGTKDPEIFALLGLFEEGFGADRLSDMTIRIIIDNLLAYTQRVSRDLKVRTVRSLNWKGNSYEVPYGVLRGKTRPLLFLPRTFLRDLPVAMSWDEIEKVASLNQELRDRLNALIAKVWTRKGKAPKPVIKSILFSNPENLRSLVAAYRKSKARAYDFDLEMQTAPLFGRRLVPRSHRIFRLRLALLLGRH